jgi:serine/threonine-protein kinase
MDGRIAELATGGRIGAYEVLNFLGRGSMGSVYGCRHAVLGLPAAIKILHPDLARDAVAVARFFREGQSVAKIRHPNVVAISDIGEHLEIPYLVMELVEGDDLATWIRQAHPVPLGIVVDCMLGIVAGVAAIHAAGIVHRDLKPSNIRFARDHLGRTKPRVLDFGISKVTSNEHGPDLTASDRALGTASYMAPEQLRSAKDVDARSDIYAMGVILYECLTGTLPFSGRTTYERMHAALTEPLAPPSALRPEVPPDLDEIVLRALRRDPDERFFSSSELGRALLPFSLDPQGWEREFAGRSANEPPVNPARSPPGEPSFTLVTGSRRTATNAPGGWRLIALGAGVALAAVGIFHAATNGGRNPVIPAEVAASAPEPSAAGPASRPGLAVASAQVIPAAPVVEPESDQVEPVLPEAEPLERLPTTHPKRDKARARLTGSDTPDTVWPTKAHSPPAPPKADPYDHM